MYIDIRSFGLSYDLFMVVLFENIQIRYRKKEGLTFFMHGQMVIPPQIEMCVSKTFNGG